MAGLVTLVLPVLGAVASVRADAAPERVVLFTCQLEKGGGFALDYAPATRTFTLALNGRQPRSYSFAEARQWLSGSAKSSATRIEMTGAGRLFIIEYSQSAFEGISGSLGEGEGAREGRAAQWRECREGTIHFHDRFGRKPWADPRYSLWDLAAHHITRGMQGWPG